MTLDVSRRGLLIGGTALICVPAIVRASSLMKVRVMEPRIPVFQDGTGTLSRDWMRFKNGEAVRIGGWELHTTYLMNASGEIVHIPAGLTQR